MDVPIVVLDACVLYPAALRDLFMRLAVAGLIQARWTDLIHEEWIVAVLRDRPDLERADLDRTRRLMDEHAEGSLVRHFEHLIPSLQLPDPDDRHVLAAAMEEGAEWIVTWNVIDFPGKVVEPLGITITTPDELMTRLLGARPEDTRAVVRETRLSLKNPPKSIDEYLEILRVRGLIKAGELLAEFRLDL